MMIDFQTILGISTVSVLCIFAGILGLFSNDIFSNNIANTLSETKFKNNVGFDDKINPQDLQVIYHGGLGNDVHSPQYPPFERSVQISHVTVLATVQSSEEKLIDESYYDTNFVMIDGFEEAYDAVKQDPQGTLEEKLSELRKVYEQYRTDETYETLVENHVPYQFVTLKVDQYLKDYAEKFTDTIVVKISGSGEGVREDENVYYVSNTESPVGEQAMYMLQNYHILFEEGHTKMDEGDDYRIIAKYNINSDNTIQSEYGEYILERLERYEQKAIQNNSTVYDPERHTTQKKWTLPIPLDEAIIRAQNQANSVPLIINYSNLN